MHRTTRALVLLTLATGCAARGPRVPGPLHVVTDVPPELRPPGPRAARPPARRAPRPPTEIGERLARAAEGLLGGRVPSGFRDDCSGFVAAAADRAGLALTGGTADLYAAALLDDRVHHRHLPATGDLVFFDRTYDRDGNGRIDDPLTHVGVVIGVEADGTVRVAHNSDSAGLSELRMNLRHPNEATGPAGEAWNQPLRRARKGEAPEDVLASTLWRSFAAPTR